ncbi:hypothetical protein ACFE04_006088 [Oxalis oulophora]
MSDSEEENNQMDIDNYDNVIPPVFKATLEAKLRELLHNITSLEIKLCSHATKQFKKLLKSSDGGTLLKLYVQTSSELDELIQAWNHQQGKSGLRFVFSLISKILSHCDGMCVLNDKERVGVSSALDKFARRIIRDKKGDVDKELNSDDWKRQKSAVLLLGSLVRRGSGLAYYVAKSFASDVPVSKLITSKQKGNDKKGKQFIVAKAFVQFTMSFLEVGRPESLNLVMKMYPPVLQWLENSDDETLVYVLSLLRDKVLSQGSLIPWRLKHILFGRDNLEHLIRISGSEKGGAAAELAHDVLVTVCTDPTNGLMPDFTRHPNPIKGNPKLLLLLMKKLKASEVEYHRELVLLIVKGRPVLGSAYMEEFPYNLDNFESPNWFANISLAADLVSSVSTGLSFGFLYSQSHDCLRFENVDVQIIMKCICPRPFTRSVIGKGLRHPNFLINHGALRLLSEMLKLLNSFLEALNHGSCCISASVKREIQDKVQTLLPDPQVFSLVLARLSGESVTTDDMSKKRKADKKNFPEHTTNVKKLKGTVMNDETDIIISGIGYPENSETVTETITEGEVDDEQDILDVISEIWGPDLGLTSVTDAGMFFHSKLLDAFTIYRRTMPTASQGSFDCFKLVNNSTNFPVYLQISLLSLLIEDISVSIPSTLHRHLEPFLKLFISSSTSDVKDKAYKLARSAMISTGAFDRNLHEIDAWFLYLPGYGKENLFFEGQGTEVCWSLSKDVVSFLCKAIPVGNKLFKYWDIVRLHTHRLKGFKDASPHFSPLVISIIENCLTVLNSESKNLPVAKKTSISLYVCNTIKYLLQTQVDPRLFGALCASVFSDHVSLVNDSGDSLCEWKPLKNLLLFLQSVSHEKPCCILPVPQMAKPGNSSFERTIEEVKNLLQCEHKTAGIVEAFFSAVLCTTSDELLHNLPSVVNISQHLQIPISLLSSIISREPSFLADASKLWPEMLSAGLEMALSPIHDDASENSLFGESITRNAMNSVTKALSYLLKHTPFHIIFPSVLNIDVPCLLNSSKLLDLLLSKLSACSSSCLLSYLHLGLFWFHQIQLSDPSINLDQQAEICFVLVNKVFAQLFCSKPDSEASASFEVSMENIHEAAETLFCHPAVKISLTSSFSSDKQLSISGSFESFVGLSRQVVRKTDHQVLDMLKAIFDCLFFPSSDQQTIIRNEDAKKTSVKAFEFLAESLFLEVKKQFDVSIKSEDLKPLLSPFCALHALIRYMSPLKLLELSQWMFDRVDVNRLTVNSKLLLSIGIFIARSAFENLQSFASREPSDIFWEIEENYNNFGNLLVGVYLEVCTFATKHELEVADECLLKAVNLVHTLKKFSLLRVIMNTPTEIIPHCLSKTSRTKAKLLFRLTEISPLHLSVFGQLFVDKLDSDLTNEQNGGAFSVKDYMFLLPVAVLYMKSVFVKFGKQHQRFFYCIPSFYAKILCNNLPKLLESDYFQEDYEKFSPLSAENLHSIFNASLLGKAIVMLQYHFTINGYSTEISLVNNEELIDCDFAKLIDCDFSVIDYCWYSWSQNLINRVIAKVTLGRVLYFSEISGTQSSREHSSRVPFVNMLVTTWQILIEKFPCVSQSSKNGGSKDHVFLFKYLEDFILKNILELITVMDDDFIKLESFPFVEKIVKPSLRFRFEDLKTLDMLQKMQHFLSDGEILEHLNLLTGHSKFNSTIQSELSSSKASGFSRPLSSILRSFPTIDCNNDLESSKLYSNRLEIVKLLRTLFQYGSLDIGKYPDLYLKDLHFLLLTSYGATNRAIDVEIYNLMCAIESIDKSVSENIAQTGYLWGDAALKVRKQDNITDSDFREYLSIDPKIVVRTVLDFPYGRIVNEEPLSPQSFQLNDFKAPDVENTERYDPVFMLRFSIHALSLGFIEPVEFAGIGLLAIAFMSVSSPFIGMRKLGYEALGRFKNALEKSQKKKDVMQLRLLLTYMQNGIEKLWERIPSIIALFAAETSLILLDHTNNHYATLSDFLARSSRVKMDCIPLFGNFLWSSSANFRTERLWILRLICAGMNLEEDASMYISNSTVEILLSFHTSPISDNDSKELILQIIKKSVKLQKLACHLIEQRALLPWLSHVLSASCGMLSGEEKSSSLRQFTLVIEIINIVISSENTIKWLQKHALEQLMEISTHLLNLLIGGMKLLKENATFVSSILQILMLTLKFSQKRDLDQPHFTMSVECLYQIYHAVSIDDSRKSRVDAVLALKTILTSTPPVDLFQMDQEKLSNFLTWATSTVLLSDLGEDLEPEKSVHHLTIISEEAPYEESLVSKFQRWLIASVILGKSDYRKNLLSESSNSETLLSLLKYVEKGFEVTNKSISHCDRMLAGTIFDLNQLLGMRCKVLPSVVSALCLLRFCNEADSTEDSVLVRETSVTSLLSTIKSPHEVNPAWRWSYDGHWEDLEPKRTDLEKMDEFHACQKLLVIFPNFLGDESIDLKTSVLQNVENTDVFKWERSIFDRTK